MKKEIAAVEARNASGHESGRAVIVQGDTVVVLANTNSKGSGGYDAWILRLGLDGRLLHESTHGGALNDDMATMAVLPEGGIVAAGAKQRPEGFVGWLLAFGPDGSRSWEAEAEGAGQTSFSSALGVLGGAVIAGGVRSGMGFLTQIGSTGAAAWDARLGDVVDAVTALAAATPAGTFLAAGTRGASPVALGTSTLLRMGPGGAILRALSLPEHGRGEIEALVALSDGGTLAVGRARMPDELSSAVWLVRLDASDALVWEKRFRAQGAEQRARGAVACPDGGFLVAAETLGPSLEMDALLLRVAPDGSEVWRQTLRGSGQGRIGGIALSEDGSAVVTGSKIADTDGKTDVWVLRVSESGKLLWSTTFGSRPRSGDEAR